MGLIRAGAHRDCDVSTWANRGGGESGDPARTPIIWGYFPVYGDIGADRHPIVSRPGRLNSDVRGLNATGELERHATNLVFTDPYI